jgi:hypothetical protein
MILNNIDKLPEINALFNNSTDKALFYLIVEKTIEELSEFSEEDLFDLALIRVIEVTNGMIQYAYRDNMSYALSKEDTKAAMNFSMSIFKNSRIQFKEDVIDFSCTTTNFVNKVRDTYIQGFKQHKDDKLLEFYAYSLAVLLVVGKDELKLASIVVNMHLSHILPAKFVEFGMQYINRFLQVTIDE